MKITTTNKDLNRVPKKYVRVVITEDEAGTHRLIETKNGIVEYRVGVGRWKEVTPRMFRIIVRSIVRAAKAHKVEYIALQFSNSPFKQLEKYDETWLFSTVTENLLLADYEYTAYKTKKPKYQLKEVLICGALSKKAKKGLERGKILGTYANICRDISNTPGGDMTPALLAKESREVVKGTKAIVKVLDEKAIKQEKMGALLAVGGSAKDKPRFIILEYKGSKKTDKPIIFVGKGITFDTGGLQIKPGMSMYEMHMDMSGGAAVIAAIACAAKLKLKKNIVGLIPAAENAVGENAIRPGDVVTSMSGKTIDVLHTDAEGRLVLADALHFARKYKPKLVVDVGTLTGASLVALGQHAHAVMTKDRKLEDTLRELGEESGDYVFPLPLWDEYKQYTKGVHADVANIPPNDTKYGGAINGGMFLTHFTEGLKWAHIDMAPRMTSVPSDKLTKGATGEPTRLLVRIAERL